MNGAWDFHISEMWSAKIPIMLARQVWPACATSAVRRTNKLCSGYSIDASGRLLCCCLDGCAIPSEQVHLPSNACNGAQHELAQRAQRQAKDALP